MDPTICGRNTCNNLGQLSTYFDSITASLQLRTMKIDTAVNKYRHEDFEE